MRKGLRFEVLFGLTSALAVVLTLFAQAPPASSDARVMADSYYKVVPGKGEE